MGKEVLPLFSESRGVKKSFLKLLENVESFSLDFRTMRAQLQEGADDGPCVLMPQFHFAHFISTNQAQEAGSRVHIGWSGLDWV